MPAWLLGAVDPGTGMRCFTSGMHALHPAHPGIRSHARDFCSTGVRIQGRTPSSPRYRTRPSGVGVGEAGPVAAPPHTQARALVELLLDAGADPNDAQALYNMHFLRDEGWLELLLARGFRKRVRLDYLLGASVRQGFADRVALLLA